MRYKTIVIGYTPKAKKLAAAIEKISNEKAQAGWDLLTFSVTPSAKAILLFRVPEEIHAEDLSQAETAEAAGEAE